MVLDIYYDADEPEQSNEQEDDIMASSGTCGANLTWTLDYSGIMTISGTGTMTNYSNINNVPWYSYSTNIVVVNIKSGVTSIGNYAFAGANYRYTSIVLPDTLTSIANTAFAGVKTVPHTIYNASSFRLAVGSTMYGRVAYKANAIYTCHTITLQPNDSAMGNVSESKIFIIDGQTPTISNNTISTTVPNQSSTAIPIDSSEFTGWSGVSGSVTSNITVVAIFSSGPVMHVKVNGAWTEGKPFVKVNGAWKEATKVYIKVNGVWKEST